MEPAGLMKTQSFDLFSCHTDKQAAFYSIKRKAINTPEAMNSR